MFVLVVRFIWDGGIWGPLLKSGAYFRAVQNVVALFPRENFFGYSASNALFVTVTHVNLVSATTVTLVLRCH